MEVAVVASLFTEWDMNINARHKSGKYIQSKEKFDLYVSFENTIRYCNLLRWI